MAVTAPVPLPSSTPPSVKLVAPVPPSPTARVFVIELAPRSTAISLLSITSPPLDLRSADTVRVSVAEATVATPSPPAIVNVLPSAIG